MRAWWMTALAMAGVLAVPAIAQAGGWATVELSSTPDDVRPGQPWVVELTVLQHGLTPLEGLEPKVTVTSASGGAKRTVRAEATGEPGVYRAHVTFSRAGRWKYTVDDGFSQRHSYPPVRISGDTAAARSVADDDGGALWPAIAAAIAAGLVAAALTRAARSRSRRARPGASDGTATPAGT